MTVQERIAELRRLSEIPRSSPYYPSSACLGDNAHPLLPVLLAAWETIELEVARDYALTKYYNVCEHQEALKGVEDE